MNDKRIRYFDDFTELDTETKLKFSEFRKLNEILQSTKKSSYDIIYNWYINSVLAWDNQDVVSQEISRLIKHNYVALNSILEFGELKYPYVWDFITTQFTSLWIDETDAFQISEFLLLRNHWIITIVFIDDISWKKYKSKFKFNLKDWLKNLQDTIVNSVSTEYAQNYQVYDLIHLKA